MGSCQSNTAASAAAPSAGAGAGGGGGGGAAAAHSGKQSQGTLPAELVKNMDVKELFTFERQLGKGNFGVVFLVTEKKTGKKYACKSISKRKLVTPEDLEDVRREIQIMMHLAGHQNVVEMQGAYEDKNNFHLVLELCTGGEMLWFMALHYVQSACTPEQGTGRVHSIHAGI